MEKNARSRVRARARARTSVADNRGRPEKTRSGCWSGTRTGQDNKRGNLVQPVSVVVLLDLLYSSGCKMAWRQV